MLSSQITLVYSLDPFIQKSSVFDYQYNSWIIDDRLSLQFLWIKKSVFTGVLLCHIWDIMFIFSSAEKEVCQYLCIHTDV